MATITPSAAVVEQSQTQQFTQSGIGSPVWTLDGVGTLNQSGLYTAPNTSGSALVRAHTAGWASVNSAYFTQNADDSLTKGNNDLAYFPNTCCSARLNSVGDAVEITAYTNSPYWIGLQDSDNIYAPSSQYFVWFGAIGGVRERTSSGTVDSGSLSVVAGDILRFEIITGGFMRFSKNGVAQYTSTLVFSGGNFRLYVDGASPSGTVYKFPRFYGAGITDYTEAAASVIIQSPILLPRTNLELYCDANLLSLANGANVLSFTDQSAHLRHLTAASSYPTFQTNVINGKSIVRFNGSQNPLKNTAHFTVSCGWIVAKFNGSSFSDYKGLLSDLVNQTILVSNNSGANFFNTGIEFFEFRSNDRIYPQSNAPAPMNAFKLIFFRFWKPIVVDGIQIGQQTTFSSRKWNGDVAFLALYSRNFHESEIREYSKILADNFAITLADVYPYQSDVNNTPEKIAQSVNFYDPPEGDRISEVIGNAKRTIDLKFSVANQTEVKEMKTFHAAHYAAVVPFLYRDYRFTPPEDIEGYFDSQYELDGANNDFNYAFKFKEK